MPTGVSASFTDRPRALTKLATACHAGYSNATTNDQKDTEKLT